MSQEDYWEGPPYLAVVYRDVDRRRRNEKNEFIWLQGKYIYEAFGVVIHNAYMKKGGKMEQYPKEPYRITPLTEKEKAAAAEKERQKAIDSFNKWKAAWDKVNG